MGSAPRPTLPRLPAWPDWAPPQAAPPRARSRTIAEARSLVAAARRQATDSDVAYFALGAAAGSAASDTDPPAADSGGFDTGGDF